MCLDYRRDKLSVSFAGAAALLLAILVAPRSALLYAQEDESFTATPAAADDDADPAWAAPTTDTPEDADDGSVLDLPQVVAVGHDEAAAASADPNDPSSFDDQPSSDDQPDNLADYAAQGAVPGEAPGSSEPMMVPGAGIALVSAMTSYVIIGRTWGAPAWPGNGLTRPWIPGPIFPTSPMLTTPRGSHVIMGGWWHRTR
jgi:hypothetical protein